MRTLLAGLLCLTAAANASAAETAPAHTSRVTATILTATDTVRAGEPFQAALRLQIVPGWHTYWRNAGDAGTAPEITVIGATADPIAWPAPTRTAEGQLTTYAYTGDVVLPFRLTVPTAAPTHLAVHADWLVCRDICIPQEADFTLDLPAGTPAPSAQAALIDTALAAIPQPASFTAALAPDGTLTLTGLSFTARSAEFLPEADGTVEAHGPQPLRWSGDTATMSLSFGPAVDLLAPVAGILKVTDGSAAAYAVQTTPVAMPLQAGTSLPLLLLAALAGGCLLNLMPCVFPVLAMKAMALSRLTGADASRIRGEGLSYTAGVVTTFVALGGALLALRGAGQAAGWGFQLQSPAFVTAMAWLLFTTGLNMSDVYAVGGRLAGVGQSLTARGGHAGSFFTGLLAVLVATPCTASFMGAAVAGALAAPAPAALAVFAAMGFGLALPYLLLAAVPRLARALPRPGRWMEVLRQGLAFPIYASVAWLVWVVSQQSGPDGVGIAALGLVCLGLGAWALGLAQRSPGRTTRTAGRATAATAVLATAALLFAGTPAESAAASEPFTPARLAELRQQGRPVFVNMTAAWCISCLVNERVALSRTPVREAFARAHVTYLKGDWTRQDPAISAFLQQNGREGVPLYVFYPPNHSPILLPQVLGEATILDEVRKLGG